MTNAPRVAMIGCGLIGQKRLSNLPPGTVSVACDLDLERARRLAAQRPGCVATESVDEAVSSKSVDVVMVATLNSTLAAIAQKAIEHGKHVLVEKPGGVSVSELEQLESTARAKGVL